MDSDFEPETNDHRYTIEQFVNLNLGTVLLPPDLKSIFSKYTMPPCSMEQPHNNKHNKHFYPDGVTKAQAVGFRKKGDVYSDSNILSDLRHAFSSVVKGEDGTICATAQISQILIPPTMITGVAELFFTTIIQSPKQMTEYLDVLFGFRQPNGLERKVHFEFVKIVMNTFKVPRVLEDTPLESGISRTRKQREITCKLIATLFTYKFSNTEPSHKRPREYFGNVSNLEKEVVQPLFREYKDGISADTVKHIAYVWAILMSGGTGHRTLLNRYHDDMARIYANEKGTVRLLLRDFVEHP
jgi:hypothetical protein